MVILKFLECFLTIFLHFSSLHHTPSIPYSIHGLPMYDVEADSCYVCIKFHSAVELCQ